MASFPLKSVVQGILLAPLLSVCVGFFPGPVSGQEEPIIIKMASLAPTNSEWHDALMEMRARWREVSDGRVLLEIIPNAQGGEEADVLRRMRIGLFQAGGFTLAGLQTITPSVVVLALPLVMETQEDLHRVRAVLGPKLEEVFWEKGYKLLHWADLGWMQFFTPDDDPTPEGVMNHTYVEWGDNELTHVWRAAGFHPGVKLTMADVMMGLQTGMIDAINTTPLVVAGYQWFTKLNYMIDVHWGPLSGATLVDRRTWEQIPEDLHPELLRIAQETGETVAASLQEWEDEAIDAMKDQGLQVITPPPDVMAEWRRLFRSSMELLRGDIIPADWYDEALRLAGEGKGR